MQNIIDWGKTGEPAMLKMVKKKYEKKPRLCTLFSWGMLL